MKPDSEDFGKPTTFEKRCNAGVIAALTGSVMTWFCLAGMAAGLFLAAAQPVLGQSSEPILRLEVGTHNAGVFSIALDHSNRILVTGSEDKTVRIWDISGKGELLRILRPPVGEHDRGISLPWPCPRMRGLWHAGAAPARRRKRMPACTSSTEPPEPSHAG